MAPQITASHGHPRVSKTNAIPMTSHVSCPSQSQIQSLLEQCYKTNQKPSKQT